MLPRVPRVVLLMPWLGSVFRGQCMVLTVAGDALDKDLDVVLTVRDCRGQGGDAVGTHGGSHSEMTELGVEAGGIGME